MISAVTFVGLFALVYKMTRDTETWAQLALYLLSAYYSYGTFEPTVRVSINANDIKVTSGKLGLTLKSESFPRSAFTKVELVEKDLKMKDCKAYRLELYFDQDSKIAMSQGWAIDEQVVKQLQEAHQMLTNALNE